MTQIHSTVSHMISFVHTVQGLLYAVYLNYYDYHADRSCLAMFCVSLLANDLPAIFSITLLPLRQAYDYHIKWHKTQALMKPPPRKAQEKATNLLIHMQKMKHDLPIFVYFHQVKMVKRKCNIFSPQRILIFHKRDRYHGWWYSKSGHVNSPMI